MPSYRGFSQADVVRSINDALELLETFTTGPEMQAQVDRLRAGAPSPLGAIAAATDDAGFAQAINDSGVKAFMGRAAEVLQYHAVNDTNGKGYDMLERLVAWGAFGPVRTVYTKLDEEQDAWLAVSYARQTAMTEDNLEKLAMVTEALANDKMSAGNAFIATTALVELAQDGAPEAEMRQVFLDLGLHERHVMKGSLSALFALDGAQGAMTFQPAVRAYGVIIDGLADGTFDRAGPQMEEIVVKAETALAPFKPIDEYERMMVGVIGDWQNPQPGDPQGLIFIASARAAQAVADAMPDLKVVDFEGNSIPPRKRPQPPGAGFNP